MRQSVSLDTEFPAPKAAFLTDDHQDILRFAAESVESGYQTALVTLVEIRGGAARALGAQMAVRRDALYCGYVSGGCTEAAVAAEAVLTISAGHDRYLRLGEGSPFFDIVLPCGGGITVSIHIVRDAHALRQTLSSLDIRQRAALRYDPAAQSLASAPFSSGCGWHDGSFVNEYRPTVRLLLCGGSIEVETTRRLATASGYEVFAIAGTDRFVVDAIDEDTAVVLLHHDLDRELPVLEAALAAHPFYIGALGSSRTHDKRQDALLGLGYDRSDIARIKAPIGIFGKAKDSASLALSVLADIASVRAQSA